MQMELISEAPGHYNCSSTHVAASSINSLCVFIEAHEMARKSFMGMRRFLYPGVHTFGGQMKWIESTFSGHAQASIVLPLLNTVGRFNCNMTEMANVTCSPLV